MREVSLRKRRRNDDLRAWKGVKVSGNDLLAAFDAQSTGDVHFGQWMLSAKAPQYSMTFAHALWQHGVSWRHIEPHANESPQAGNLHRQ